MPYLCECLQRPEGVKAPGSCEPPGVDAGNQLRFSREQQAFLAAEASSLAPVGQSTCHATALDLSH